MAKSKQSIYGQFNTGTNECKFTIDEIKKHVSLSGDVLEPSYGSGNFVRELQKEDVIIDAYEVDSEIYHPIDGVNCINDDFLFRTIDKKYDFIVGNPPYIELIYSFYNVTSINALSKMYNFKGRGRVNMVHLFFDRSFELIKEDGVIAFLLPSTILSSPWYNGIRKTIYDEYTVLSLVENIPFKNISMGVCLLILQKKEDPTHKFIEKIDDFYSLVTTKNTEEKITLKDRGFSFRVGDILWYKIKEQLSDDPNNMVLVYTNNIKKGSLDIGIPLPSKIPGKKQYITGYENPLIRNCIITARVIGKKMKHYLLLDNDKYVFENHVIIITHDDVDKLKELNTIISESGDQFSQFFNSTNLTVAELMNFAY